MRGRLSGGCGSTSNLQVSWASAISLTDGWRGALSILRIISYWLSLENEHCLDLAQGGGGAEFHEDGVVAVVWHCQALRGLLGQLALTQNVGDVLDACTR